MTTLEFRNRLEVNAFTRGNEYSYASLIGTGLHFHATCKICPYIMSSPILRGDPELRYSREGYQLQNRKLNTAKIKEVMDSAAAPIIIGLESQSYIIGKGFLAQLFVPLKFLAVACYDGTKTVRGLSDITYYISKSFNDEMYKSFHPTIKDLINNHPGNVILTNDIERMIVQLIELPPGGTLRDQQLYKEQVVRESVKLFVTSSNGQEATRPAIIVGTAGSFTADPLPF